MYYSQIKYIWFWFWFLFGNIYVLYLNGLLNKMYWMLKSSILEIFHIPFWNITLRLGWSQSINILVHPNHHCCRESLICLPLVMCLIYCWWMWSLDALFVHAVHLSASWLYLDCSYYLHIQTFMGAVHHWSLLFYYLDLFLFECYFECVYVCHNYTLLQ